MYVNEHNFDDASAVGSMPVDDTEDIDWDSLGVLNVTMQTNEMFALENVLRTLRLWVAINVKIAEKNVWIQSYEQLKSGKTHAFGHSHSGSLVDEGKTNGNENVNYSISIAYYDDENQYKISPNALIREFHYLFNSKVSTANVEANDNAFILYDIYNIKQPKSSASKIGLHAAVLI